MTPRGFIITIAVVFVGGVLACIGIYAAAGIERLSSLETTSLLTRIATGLVFIGLAVGLGIGIVRGSVVERWTTVLAAGALAAGIFRNSGERPAAGIVVLGAAFALCALALLTPFAGRHFARKHPTENEGTD
jgi:hypothetical protein